MPRVSLVERYDNRSVIKQIYDLKGKTDKAIEDSAEAIAAVNQPVTASVADDTLTIGANGQTASVVLPAGGGGSGPDQYLKKTNGYQASTTGLTLKFVNQAGNDDTLALPVVGQNTGVVTPQQKTAWDGAVSVANDANTTAQQAETNAGNAVYTANQANTTADANTTAISTANTRIDKCVKSGAFVSTATDASLKLTLQDGTVSTASMPVVSATKAGIANSQLFTDVQDHGTRIEALEQAGGGHIWYVTLPNDNPTTQQVQSAYEGANPGQPAQVGYRVSDLSRGITYAYDGSTWVKQGGGTVPNFAQGVSGTIKGGNPSTDGVVIAETDGTGSVQGWAGLVGRVSTVEATTSTQQTSIDTLTSTVADADAKATTADNNATQALSDAATAQSTATYAKGKADGIGVQLAMSGQNLTATVNGVSSTAVIPTGGGAPDEYVKSIGETVTPETGGLKIGWTKQDNTAGALTIPEASSTAPGLLRKGGQPDCLLSVAGPIQGTNGKMQWQSQVFNNGKYYVADMDFPEATASADGTMSAADKAKLDTVSQGANKIEIEQDSNKIGIKIDGVETRIQEARPGQIGLMTSQQGTQLNDAWQAVRKDVSLALSDNNLTVSANGKTSAPVALPGGGGASLTPVSDVVSLTADQSQKGVISIVKADNLKIAGNAHRPVGVTCDIVGVFQNNGGSMAVVGVSYEISGDDVIPWITTVGNTQGNWSSEQTVTVWYA